MSRPSSSPRKRKVIWKFSGGTQRVPGMPPQSSLSCQRIDSGTVRATNRRILPSTERDRHDPEVATRQAATEGIISGRPLSCQKSAVQTQYLVKTEVPKNFSDGFATKPRQAPSRPRARCFQVEACLLQPESIAL